MKLKTEKGAAVVEFAVVLPLLLLLVFGIIEFGFLIYNKAMITNASREGARVGILLYKDRTKIPLPDGTEPDLNTLITDTIKKYLLNFLVTFGGTGEINIDTIPINASTVTEGDYLTVTVTYPYQFLVTPAFISDLADGVNLTGTTIMRVE